MLTMNPSAKKRFQRLLLRWFDANKRDLPWRKDADPYRVWLSEIMLQQTRVSAVLDHYRRFLERFPTVGHLARAREASVLAAWSGLGYYRRARMLHAAARDVVRKHQAKIPTSAAELRKLPGIGRYTAAAITSIAFGEPAAVVDGNVERVLQRLQGKGLAGETLWQSAQELITTPRPGDHNQALMELGATICLPKAPKCSLCPILPLCATKGEGDPVRAQTPQKKRTISYVLDHRDGLVLLTKRTNTETLMPGMWELPQGGEPNGVQPLFTVRHSITVTDYRVHVLPGPAPTKSPNSRWVRHEQLVNLPLTGLTRKILRAAKVI